LHDACARAAQEWQRHRGTALNEGFLGTAAPRYADVVLLLEIGMGLGLLAGALLARMRRFRAHAWCQSATVLLNLAIIVLVMVPSFRSHVSPRIPLKLGKAYYAVATAHAALGSVVEGAGLYILLAAGTDLLPEKLRITRYKLWMRTVLVAWWVVLFLELATYARWYIPHLFPR
jgi:Ca2+/H+ antiporter